MSSMAILQKKNEKEKLKKVETLIHVRYRYGKSWGAFPVVSATLDAMQKFSNNDYDYFVNLSGQCCPLKSNVAIKKQFLHGKNNTFMGSYKMLIPSKCWKITLLTNFIIMGFIHEKTEPVIQSFFLFRGSFFLKSNRSSNHASNKNMRPLSEDLSP